MKTIYIARHAKSSWKNKQIIDVDRPLKPSGIIALQKISERLKNTATELDAIYTSPALRAKHTALIHARYLDFPENRIEIRNSIYDQRKEGLFDLIKSFDNNLNSIMICGHDPTLTDFVNDFLRIPLNKIQTSAVMKIQFHSDSWSQIQFADVEQLIYFNRQETKELKYAKTGN